jgi:hypothetical protein
VSSTLIAATLYLELYATGAFTGTINTSFIAIGW